MEKQDEIGGDTAKATHTPGPWRLSGNVVRTDLTKIGLSASAGVTIASVVGGARSGAHFPQNDEEVAANAAFIVRACNGWYELIAALRELQANPNDPRAHRTALDAIAKASEQQ